MENGKKSLVEISLSAVTALLLLISVAAPNGVKSVAALASAYAVLPGTGYNTLRMMEPFGKREELHTQSQDGTETTHDDGSVRQGETTGEITETPSDVLKIMEKAQAAAGNEKKDGDILSCTYGKASSTSIFENILVRNTTSTKSLNIEKMLEFDGLPKISDREKPCILIYHTHTTEGFELLDRDWYASDQSSRTTDETRNIVRVGREIAEVLSAQGFNVIHDVTVHDTSYSGAYDRSRKTVEKYLDEYPEILITLDIHRDAIQENDGTKIKPVTEILGKKAAQIMIIAGAEEDSVTDFSDWKYNLSFALKIQKACEDNFSGLMRPILFCQRKYNMDMTRYSLLVEMGSEANTLEEAVYSGRLLAYALSDMLSK